MQLDSSLDKTHAKPAAADFRPWLQEQLTSRCKVDPRFSLRAFANLIDTDASSVSQILSGKRNASTKVINHVCDKLNVDNDLRYSFLASLRKPDSRDLPRFKKIAEDSFAVIADWYHFAILELSGIEGFDPSPIWIAQALGIKSSEARAAVERLLRLGLLYKEENRLVKTNSFITNYKQGRAVEAHKIFQRQIIQMALKAVDECAADDKDITSMTIPVDPAKLPEARTRIAKFRRELAAFLEDGEQSRVYHLGLQLYPVSVDVKKSGPSL